MFKIKLIRNDKYEISKVPLILSFDIYVFFSYYFLKLGFFTELLQIWRLEVF